MRRSPMSRRWPTCMPRPTIAARVRVTLAARAVADAYQHARGARHEVELDINRQKHTRRGRAAHHACSIACATSCCSTGAHAGCEHGVCGACTVLIDGARGALLPDVRGAGRRLCHHHHRRAVAGAGRAVAAAGRVLRDARHAVRLLHAGDDPGRARAACRRTPQPTREEIVDAISGNICRCTGYAQIVEAIALAAERMRGAEPAAGARHERARQIPLRLVRPPRARGPPLRRRQGQLRGRHRAGRASSTSRW